MGDLGDKLVSKLGVFEHNDSPSSPSSTSRAFTSRMPDPHLSVSFVLANISCHQL